MIGGRAETARFVVVARSNESDDVIAIHSIQFVQEAQRCKAPIDAAHSQVLRHAVLLH